MLIAFIYFAYSFLISAPPKNIIDFPPCIELFITSQFFFKSFAVTQIYIKKKKTSFIMAHSNDYLSVIYTGSILLFTLALKGARATFIYM